jgi:hypothetical protein
VAIVLYMVYVLLETRRERKKSRQATSASI